MDASKPSESPFADTEVRAFIDAAPAAATYSQLADECQRRFGPDRAWSAERIRAYCLLAGAALHGQRTKFAGDPEVVSYVEDRIGRMSYVALAAECARRFGRRRAPGKSSLQRYAVYLAALLRQT